MKVRFVSTNYVLEAFPDHDLSDEVVAYAIDKAQDLHIHKALGSSLYTDIKTKVFNSVLTGTTDVTLMQEYIQPCLRDYALYELVTLNAYKVSRAGLMKSQNENFQSTTIEEMRFMKSEIRDSGEFYEERLKYYLDCNSNLFPQYNTGTQDLTGGGRGSSYFFGIS
jgi:hypothetical protein